MSDLKPNINHIWEKGEHDKYYSQAHKDFGNSDYSEAEDYINRLFEAVEYWRDMASTYADELNSVGYGFDEDGFQQLLPDAPDPLEDKDRELSKIINIVAFCALMENTGGVMDKSPDYILEKFNRYCTSNRDEVPWGLDSMRKRIVSDWCKKWLGKAYDAIRVDKWINKLKNNEQA